MESPIGLSMARAALLDNFVGFREPDSLVSDSTGWLSILGRSIGQACPWPEEMRVVLHMATSKSTLGCLHPFFAMAIAATDTVASSVNQDSCQTPVTL